MRPHGSITPDARDLEAWSADLDIPPAVVRHLCEAYADVAQFARAEHLRCGRPIVVGVNGAQGTGKTTLVALVTRLLETCHGLRATGLSLDDLYLTRSERVRLAAEVHPLLETRGVPGTHDVQLGHETLDALTSAEPREVAVPSFDKAADDRVPVDRWPRVRAPLDVVLLEGWCIGARPEPPSALGSPRNDLERDRDPDGRWRAYVNAQLEGPYAELFARLDTLVALVAPDLDCVRAWRREQEHGLRRRLLREGRRDTTMSDEEVDRFIQYFERLTTAMLAELPGRADVVLRIGRDHQITSVELPKRESPG